MRLLIELNLDLNKVKIILYVVVPILIIFIGYFNIMLKKQNRIRNAASTIDVMLKKRNDLIPNLVNTVKGMMHHERMVFDHLTELRASLADASLEERQAINGEISKCLNGILLLSESYPSLKADQNFLNLQRALRDIEETISAARRTYNAHVTSYNTFISIFPNVLFAKLYRFKKHELFAADEEDKKGKISFDEK